MRIFLNCLIPIFRVLLQISHNLRIINGQKKHERPEQHEKTINGQNNMKKQSTARTTWKNKLDQRFTFSTSALHLVTSKQSSTPYHWLTPGYYKDKVKTSAVHHIPFTFARHICDLTQHPLKLISAPQVKKPWVIHFRKIVSSNEK